MHDTRRTRIVLGVLLAAALALITINYRGGTGSRVGGLRGLGGSVFGSVESAASLVTRPVAAFTDGLTGSSSQSKINALQRQVVDLRAQLNQQRLSKYDEGQLGQLLQLAGRGRYRIVTASVIAAGAAYDDSVTIDAGRVDGIKPDETVLNGQGLVGTVTSASATTSTVLLATDASVTVGVRLAGTGQIGVVSGTGKSHDRRRPAPAPGVRRQRDPASGAGAGHLRLGRRPCPTCPACRSGSSPGSRAPAAR